MNETGIKLFKMWTPTRLIIWHIDAAFGAHEAMKSNTGTTMTLGEEVVITGCTKPK